MDQKTWGFFYAFFSVFKSYPSPYLNTLFNSSKSILVFFFFACLCAATDGMPFLYLSCFAHQAREWTSYVVERESTLFLLGNAVNSRCLHVYISVCCWCCCCFDPVQKKTLMLFFFFFLLEVIAVLSQVYSGRAFRAFVSRNDSLNLFFSVLCVSAFFFALPVAFHSGFHFSFSLSLYASAYTYK